MLKERDRNHCTMSIIVHNNPDKCFYSDEKLLENILTPYKSNCRYLKKARLEFDKNALKNETDDIWVAKGEFSIPQSCYIQNTGHFNSVEFNICYNQLTYYLLAECINNHLIPEFLEWNMDKYYYHQLSDLLIVTFQSSFHKKMKSDCFEGMVTIKKIYKKNKSIFIQTICEFNDSIDKCSSGKVLLAIVNTI